jgi:hypothetical protein
LPKGAAPPRLAAPGRALLLLTGSTIVAALLASCL